MNRIAPICFLLCLLSLPALAQTPITGPTIFYKYGSPGAPASADVAGGAAQYFADGQDIPGERRQEQHQAKDE